ncbi:MAG TPA: hypothetical protein VGP94_01920, partial [Tepidisphaeraceae bacterium]|nr:hypothetical protein [Tepidisphaeraceae bacterium]
MSFRLNYLCLACIAMAGVCFAQTTRPTTLPTTLPTTRPFADDARIEHLIHELSADAWQTRQKAQDALVQYGLDIRPRLATVLRETKDEEARTRVEAALRQIEENRTTGASLITLHMKGASPKEVFAEISRQASAELRPSPVNLWESKSWPAVDLDFERQPFWQAIGEVCNKFGLAPQNNMAMEMVIGEKSAGPKLWGEAPSLISGPFLIVCGYINRSHSIDLNQAANVRRSCTVQFMIYPEPKMRVLQGTHSVRIEEAVDEKGHTLAIPGLPPDMGFNTNTWPWSMSASLMPQVNTGKQIARLRGSGRFIIQTRAEQAEIGEVQNARGVTKIVAGKRFTLKEVRKQGNQYVAMVTLYRAGWSPNEWNYMMYPQQTFRMVDARGVPLMRLGNGTGGGGPDQMDIDIQFQRQNWNGTENAGEPVKLLWEVPVEMKEIGVPFEFTDLP